MSDNNNNEDNSEKSETVIKFPTLAERDRHMRKQREEEARAQKAKQRARAASRAANDVPFLNLNRITPFVKYFTAAILLVHTVIFLFLSYPARHDVFIYAGFIPANFTNTLGALPWYAPITFFSHVFIHGSWMHLIFNTVMLLAMGILFERSYGTRATAIFFFACALGGALLQLALTPYSTSPVIGASGGISGLFAAGMMILNDRGQMGKIGKYGAWPVLGFWLGFMLIAGFLSGENTAWQAHIGGFIAGAGLYYALKTKRIKL